MKKICLYIPFKKKDTMTFFIPFYLGFVECLRVQQNLCKSAPDVTVIFYERFLTKQNLLYKEPVYYVLNVCWSKVVIYRFIYPLFIFTLVFYLNSDHNGLALGSILLYMSDIDRFQYTFPYNKFRKLYVHYI